MIYNIKSTHHGLVILMQVHYFYLQGITFPIFILSLVTSGMSGGVNTAGDS